MIVYIVTLVMVALFGTLEYRERYRLRLADGAAISTNKNIYQYILVGIFLFVGGFRFQVGTDYGAYARFYMATWPAVWERIITFDEPIIYIITNISRMIWNDGIFVIFVENAITVLLVFKGIREWADESWTMSLLMYILYCGWTFSFNGVRQGMAAAFIFAFSKKVNRHWVLKYVLVAFVAFLIHKTAIFMLPVLLLANRKITWGQIAIIVIAAAALPSVAGSALALLGGSMNSDYAVHSVNNIRILVSAVPAILILTTSNDFREKNGFLINMAIINALITFSTRNSALLYRFSSYTNMYLMLFIPRYAKMITSQSRSIYYGIALWLFASYFFYEVSSGSGSLNNFRWVFGHFGQY